MKERCFLGEIRYNSGIKVRERGTKTMNQILLVEDDLEICEILQFYLLEREDYNVTIANSAEQALHLFELRKFDLLLLDIMLPGMNGIEFCQAVRRTSYCPIIFISCINDDETIIRALNMGGDDYLVKPFQAPVLQARIEANLRRSRMEHGEPSGLAVGQLFLNTETHTVSKEGRRLSLSPTEYEILYYLMKKKGQFVSFEDIYQAVWQRPSLGDVRALFVHVSHLRQKIEDNPADPKYICTHMRGGYILSEPSASG
jgi:DNA-binding response OmpR family regulator